VDWFLEHRPPGIDEEAIRGLRDRFLDDEPAP
jgi:hypothetical protein